MDRDRAEHRKTQPAARLWPNKNPGAGSGRG